MLTEGAGRRVCGRGAERARRSRRPLHQQLDHGRLFRLLKESGQDIATIKVAPGGGGAGGLDESRRDQCRRGQAGVGRDVRHRPPAAVIVEARGLAQISVRAAGADREETIAANPKAVQDYREGKKAAVGFDGPGDARQPRQASPQVVNLA